MKNNRGFTLIELLLVIAIMAILAATIVPNFIGFDSEAKVAATKSNLDTLQSRIMLFRAKTGRYPDSLGELTTTYYMDVGVKKPYLKKLPYEMVSAKDKKNNYIDASSLDPITNQGGWIYFFDIAEVKVNWNRPLDNKWGTYEGEIPSEW